MPCLVQINKAVYDVRANYEYTDIELVDNVLQIMFVNIRNVNDK